MDKYKLPKSSCGVLVNGNLDKALRKFKKQVKEKNILKDYQASKEYIKPSAKKRQNRKKS
jgi:ribosomal protein S21